MADTARGSSYPLIWEVVRQIPAGRVATYGQVAVLAGLPGRARQVGYAMHALPEGNDVPWQRVINARGEVSPRSQLGDNEGAEHYQRHLLEAEGIAFDERGRISLSRYRWEPSSDID